MATRIFLIIISIALVNSSIDPKEIDIRVVAFANKIAPYKKEIINWARSFVDRPGILTNQGQAEYLNCEVCRPAFQFVRPIVENGGTEEDITLAVSRICKWLDLAPTDDICYPTIRGFVTPIVYILTNKPQITDDDFCGIINSNCGKVNKTYISWETPLFGKKPEKVNRPTLPSNVPRTKILQFTDIHLDMDYKVGTTTVCDYPFCCREYQGIPTDPMDAAGPFGHKNCGLSVSALEEMLRKAKEDHSDARYIFLTGDYVHSAVWEYNISTNGRHIKKVMELVSLHFPNTTIIPVSGNHETDIVNMYPPPQVQGQFPLHWMYSAVSENFEHFMGEPGQVASFHHGGFYTVSPEPGLRFVLLNTNLCYIQNFWLPYDPVDPIGQLKWFSETLAKAEIAKENVYVIAHIPPGTDACWGYWSSQYYKVISRYSHLIRFQIHGHTHDEFYYVTFDIDEKGRETPISMSFMGPSANADLGGVAFKVYHVDGERGLDSTWELIDHETFILNSTASNINNRPIWYQEYSASKTFGLAAHRPEDYYNLTLRMVKDKKLYQTFELINEKSDHQSNRSPCKEDDLECISRIVCKTVNYNSQDPTMCNRIRSRLNGTYVDPDKSTAIRIFQSFVLLLLPFSLIF